MDEAGADLVNLKCVPCRGGVPPLERTKIAELLPLVAGWDKITEDGYDKIRKRYKLKDFREAMDFVNRVAAIAEDQGHHPDIYIQWNVVVLTLWTHAIKGLHENDFIVAAKIDQSEA